jgi:SAM-dependent methyltransferase
MRNLVAFLAVVLSIFPAVCQTREEVEKRIAQLPPDQRAYERYRYWVTMQPPEARRSSDIMQKYRAYLKAQGFADADIEAQIKVVTAQGTNLEVQRWNQILTAENPGFNTAPNAFLVEMVKDRMPGTALDVGMGQGRNAIWLAQRAWTVTGFDPANEAVALANRNAEKLGVHITTEITTDDKFNFGENRWDLILLSYVGARGLTERIERALKPHGILVVEAFHRDATKGNSIGGGVVFDTGELIKIFPGLRVVRYEEPMAIADFGKQKVRVVRYCAEKVE